MTIKKLDPSPSMKGKGLDKKSILYLIVITAAVIICIGVVYYFSKQPEITVQEPAEKTMEEIKVYTDYIEKTVAFIK